MVQLRHVLNCIQILPQKIKKIVRNINLQIMHGNVVRSEIHCCLKVILKCINNK